MKSHTQSVVIEPNRRRITGSISYKPLISDLSVLRVCNKTGGTIKGDIKKKPQCVFQWPHRPLFASSTSGTTTSPNYHGTTFFTCEPVTYVSFTARGLYQMQLCSFSWNGFVILSSCSSLLVRMLVSDILQIAHG